MTTENTKHLYHFTSLLHLPRILQEGISRGEVPISPDERLNAPNLTTNGNPSAHRWAAGSGTDKTKVRLTVHVPEGDGRLEPWKDVCRRLRVERWWQRRLDPTGQARFWFIYWGVIPPEWIKLVELRRDEGYVPCPPDELRDLLAAVEAEHQKLVFVGNLLMLKDGCDSCWLLDGRSFAGPRPIQDVLGRDAESRADRGHARDGKSAPWNPFLGLPARL